jgi:hypothetical protein
MILEFITNPPSKETHRKRATSSSEAALFTFQFVD